MLNTTLNLYRAEITINGKTTNMFFDDHEQFQECVKMICAMHKDDDFEICSHGWYDMKVVGC